MRASAGLRGGNAGCDRASEVVGSVPKDHGYLLSRRSAR
jgi:hypothetical protein